MDEIYISALFWMAAAVLVREFLWPVLVPRRQPSRFTGTIGPVSHENEPAECKRSDALNEARVALEDLEGRGEGDCNKAQAWRRRVEALEG